MQLKSFIETKTALESLFSVVIHGRKEMKWFYLKNVLRWKWENTRSNSFGYETIGRITAGFSDKHSRSRVKVGI